MKKQLRNTIGGIALCTASLLGQLAVGVGLVALSGGWAQAQAQPSTGHRYTLTVQGVVIGEFTDLSVSSVIEVTEYWETSGSSINLNKIPGRVHPPSITLKRALNSDGTLSAWHQAVSTGVLDVARKDANLILYSDGKVVARFVLTKAWPSKLELTAPGSTGPIVETVTFSCESMLRTAM